MKSPLISVILPAFNAEKTIESVLNSIVDQTLINWECIVVDDCSTDSTNEIVRRLTERDSRFILLRNANNLGLPGSLNRAIVVSHCNFIARVDADDPLHPERFSLQTNYLKKNADVDIVGSGARVTDNGKFMRNVTMPSILNGCDAANLTSPIIFHSSAMIRRSFFEKWGLYDPRYVRSEDRELWIRALSSGAKIANLPDALISYESAGWSRNYKSIRDKALSTWRIGLRYELPVPLLTAVRGAAHMLSIKWGLHRPRALK